MLDEVRPISETILRGERPAISCRIICGGCAVTTAVSKIPGSPSAVARSPMLPPPTASGACWSPRSKPPAAPHPAALRSRNRSLSSAVPSAPRNATASGRSRKTCSGSLPQEAISSTLTRPGPSCSAGARTRSKGCMSASCAIPAMRRIPRRGAPGLPPARRRCGWKTAFATRMARGAGSPGRCQPTLTASSTSSGATSPRSAIGGSPARARAAFRSAGRCRHRLRDLHARSARHRVELEQGAERIKGYRAEEIIGRHFSHFYTPEDHRGGRARARAGPGRRPARPLRRRLARAQGRLALSGRACAERDPRRKGRTDRLCQDDARHHRAAQRRKKACDARRSVSRNRKRWKRSAN